MRGTSVRFLWLFEIVNFFLHHDWFWWLLGRCNASGWVKSIFMSYPANDAYAKEYVYAFRIGSWRLRLTGFLWQNSKLIIMFTLFVEEAELLKRVNKEKLETTVNRMEKIRMLLRADSKTFAGVLPGVLVKRGLVKDAPEADITASIVIKAIELVNKEMGMQAHASIVVLGGKGFIGKRVVDRLSALDKAEICVIDLGERHKWPRDYMRKVIVNLARHDTIQSYYDLLRAGDIVINEAYPAPTSENVSIIRSLQCDCFHIVGVKAGAFPRFTHAYQGGIPCCAAWDAPEKEVIVKKMI